MRSIAFQLLCCLVLSAVEPACQIILGRSTVGRRIIKPKIVEKRQRTHWCLMWVISSIRGWFYDPAYRDNAWNWWTALSYFEGTEVNQRSSRLEMDQKCYWIQYICKLSIEIGWNTELLKIICDFQKRSLDFVLKMTILSSPNYTFPLL